MDREDNQTQTLDQPVDACPPDPATVDRVLGGAHHDPHSVLGAHPHPHGTVIRVLRPHADEVHVVRVGGQGFPLVRVHDAGLFSGLVPGPPADYRLAVRYGERVDIVDDPYRWLPTLGEVDLHLIGEGRHERLWDVLGAHVRHYETPAGPVTGTSFAVWAPTAQGVRVTGDFDGWSGWAHPMRVLGGSGIWEIFVPGIEPGTRYKFRILGADGRWRDKADPLAFATEIPPATASVVDVATHEWADGEWMESRASRPAHAAPMSVYEVHLGSWRPGLDYHEMAHQLVDYLDETGFTHIELLPVAEHPFGGSWGYQVTSYYAPTARFGRPDDFRYFVDHLHQHGYGVIVDWVPAHFPRDEWALAKFDGTPLYEHADPRRGEQPDWGTLVFDFGRKEVRNFLVANALYWLDQFHIDGLRVDAVASMLYLDYSRPEGQWLPNIHGGRENLDAVAFLQEMNATVYRVHPGAITIAEESTAWPGVSRPTHLGGLGFGMKWNMGWMHDTLDYVGRDPVYRGYHHNQMTFSLMYAFSENFVLPISHDEVVHGKGSLWERMPGDAWNKAAGVRALLAYMWAHPGKQLLFQGGEFGQEREWSESRSLDWHLLEDPLHSGIKSLVGDLNRAYRDNPALWTRDTTPDGFSWIDANDAAGNVLSFLRHGVDADGRPTVLACIANFSGTPKPDYRVGLPFAGRWREVVNTDADVYGGSGVGNFGAVEADRTPWHGRPASAVLQLPPSGVLWLVPEPFEGAVRRRDAIAAATTEPATSESVPTEAEARGIAGVLSGTAVVVEALVEARPEAAEPETDPVPSAGEPAADESVLDADTAQAPAAEAPVTEAPVTEAPVTEAPVTEAPVAEAPAAEAPGVPDAGPDTTATDRLVLPTPVDAADATDRLTIPPVAAVEVPEAVEGVVVPDRFGDDPDLPDDDPDLVAVDGGDRFPADDTPTGPIPVIPPVGDPEPLDGSWPVPGATTPAVVAAVEAEPTAAVPTDAVPTDAEPADVATETEAVAEPTETEAVAESTPSPVDPAGETRSWARPTFTTDVTGPEAEPADAVPADPEPADATTPTAEATESTEPTGAIGSVPPASPDVEPVIPTWTAPIEEPTGATADAPEADEAAAEVDDEPPATSVDDEPPADQPPASEGPTSTGWRPTGFGSFGADRDTDRDTDRGTGRRDDDSSSTQ